LPLTFETFSDKKSQKRLEKAGAEGAAGAEMTLPSPTRAIRQQKHYLLEP
jgi:hypothetical protein